MPTETNCPNCRQALTVPDAPQGRLAKCAYCGSVFPLADALAARNDALAARNEALAASDDAVAAGGGNGGFSQPLQSTAPGVPRAGAAEPPEPAPPSADSDERGRDDERPPASDPGVGEPAAEAVPGGEAPRPAPSPAPTSPASPTSGPVPSPSPTAAAAVGAVAVGQASGWFLRIPEGRSYGPVDRAKLERWLQEGRIDADCFLREGEQAEWIPAATIFPQLRSFGAERPFDNVPPDVRRSSPMPQTAYAPRTQGYAPAPQQAYAPHAGPNPQYSNPQYGGSQPAGADRNAGAYFAGHPVRRTATSDSYSASPYGGQPNATGSPFRAPHIQPHRGEIVFLLGLFGMLLGCPVFSGAAWYLGGADLKAMNLGLMNPDGRGMTTFGYVLGIVVSCFWIVAVLITMLIVSVSILTQ